MEQYVHKGDCILVRGSLKQESWQDKDGNKRSQLSVTVQELQFVTKKGNGQSKDQPERPQGANPKAKQQEISYDAPPDSNDESEIPF